MEDKKLIIPIDQIKTDFDKFLTPEHNRRIIFSGPFGIGKTYFLHEFFDDKKEYFPVFLRPINYSLLSNEDVFRFIKYDILCQLVENEKFDIEKSFDFTGFDYTKLFLGQNGFAILFNLLKYMPKIGTYVKASQKLGVLVEKFQEGLKSFNENKELKALKEFGEQTENHFLFENDGVTEFISQQLKKIVSPQSEGEQKKKVLIIDDLDRLDPEHIFRLFNVFSAHFDQVHYYENPKDNDNKFGFDKVIFVCDIENIRKIFAHKYGSEVDFSGYIDKFYSTEIFYLFHKDVFENTISPFLERKLQIRNNDGSLINISMLFQLIIKLLFVGNELNIRMLKRFETYLPSFVNESNVIKYQPILFTKFGSKENSVLSSYRFLIIIKVLIELFSSGEELVRKFSRALIKFSEQDDIYHSHYYKEYLPELVLFADIYNHKFQFSTKEKQRDFNYEKMNLSYLVNGIYFDRHYSEGDMWFYLRLSTSERKIANIEFYSVLIESIKVTIEEGIL